MSVELDPELVAVAKGRARAHSREAADLHERARAASNKARVLQRTWGFDLCPAGHGEQCCGAYDLCAAAPAEDPSSN